MTESVPSPAMEALSTMAISSSKIAQKQERRSCGTSRFPSLVVLSPHFYIRPSAITGRRVFAVLATSKYGRSPSSRSELGNSAICSAAYGSANGNGRPGSGVQKPGDGHNSGFFTEDPKISMAQSADSYFRQDFKAEKMSATPKERRKTFVSRSERAARKSPANERQGDDPYRILKNGVKVYLDELDVITLLEPPPFLRPLQSVYYNHAAFLWKKIGDIPDKRRHRLLDLLLPRLSLPSAKSLPFLDFAHGLFRHISRMWELSKLRFEDPNVFGGNAADMLPRLDIPDPGIPMVWDGRVSQVPWYLKFFSRFQKVFFIGGDNEVYGRVITGGKFLNGLSDKLAPLYFRVIHADSVLATEELCDLVLEYGNGQLHLRDLIPPGFVNPAAHLPPFNDNARDYLRAVGPGVMVGQCWVEGRKLEQYPRRLFGAFIMVQRLY